MKSYKHLQFGSPMPALTYNLSLSMASLLVLVHAGHAPSSGSLPSHGSDDFLGVFAQMSLSQRDLARTTELKSQPSSIKCSPAPFFSIVINHKVYYIFLF